jgi:ribosomal protein L22
VATNGQTTEVRAEAKWVRTSARKARLVAEHIRGRSVPEARTVLAFTPRAAARELEKVLRSAVANAEANHGLVGDDLYVSTAVVNEGPTLKRWRARARGRVARIRKRTCHIEVRLARMPESAAPARPAPARRARRPGAAPPQPETAAVATAAVEDKPKRASRARTPKREAAPTAEPSTATTSEQDEASKKPRRRRAQRTPKESES